MQNFSDKAFHNEDVARSYLENIRWPDGPSCPFCGQLETVKGLPPKGSMGKGWYHCRECRKKFTVRVGTLYERSKVPLHKWLFATYLMASSKKGISAHQMHRMLGVTYKTAWFMAHRIREAMREGPDAGPLGGKNKVVEADETYVGGKSKNRAYGDPPKKEAVIALVERGGRVRSTHVANVTAKTLKPMLRTQVDRASFLMTDGAPVYDAIGKEFRAHATVNHSIKEYVRFDIFHTNTAENYFSILKRGITGVYHHCSEQHLKRYIGEFDFRYNYRAKLGYDDIQRTVKALQGIEGKRLTYRRINA